jgi:hypothetical protein
MADWRQIQARIRKAKNAADPAAKLSELYQRTRDGMVAWEIGAVEEKNGRSDEAVKWYKVAAEKFRRADWKKKAEEALTRLGVESPENSEKQDPTAQNEELVASSVAAVQDLHEMGGGGHDVPSPLALGEIPEEADDEDAEESDEADERQPESLSQPANAANGNPNDPKKKRRRGRRGGRGRRRKGGVGATHGLPAQAFAASGSPAAAPIQQTAPQPAPEQIAAASAAPERAPREVPQREPQRPRVEPVHAVPQLPSERAAHGRSDPALSSRMSHLESLLRRLMQSPLHRLGEADEAPAGPGVFLLSDSDQSSYYYIEACQTLRVGVGNLVRGVRAQKSNRAGRSFSDSNLKQMLAEYLGINETKVSQYLKDHCVVRWIQLDDEANNLAHFAIGILRTPLNAE